MREYCTFLVCLAVALTMLAKPSIATDDCETYYAQLTKGLQTALTKRREAQARGDSDAATAQVPTIRYIVSEMRAERPREPRPYLDEPLKADESWEDGDEGIHGSRGPDDPYQLFHGTAYEAKPEADQPKQLNFPKTPQGIEEERAWDRKVLSEIDPFYRNLRYLRKEALSGGGEETEVVVHTIAGTRYEQMSAIQRDVYTNNTWSPSAFQRLLRTPGSSSLCAFNKKGEMVGYVIIYGGRTRTVILDMGVAPGHSWDTVGGKLLDTVTDRALSTNKAIKLVKHTESIEAQVSSNQHPLFRLLKQRHFENSATNDGAQSLIHRFDLPPTSDFR